MLEDLMSFPEAAKTLPGHVAIQTLHRWRLHGINGVKLVTMKIGGRRYVSAAALDDFVRRTTEAADGSTAPDNPVEHRADSIAVAEVQLDAARIGKPRRNA